MASFYYKLIGLMLLFKANPISSVRVRSLLQLINWIKRIGNIRVVNDRDHAQNGALQQEEQQPIQQQPVPQQMNGQQYTGLDIPGDPLPVVVINVRNPLRPHEPKPGKCTLCTTIQESPELTLAVLLFLGVIVVAIYAVLHG